MIKSKERIVARFSKLLYSLHSFSRGIEVVRPCAVSLHADIDYSWRSRIDATLRGWPSSIFSPARSLIVNVTTFSTGFQLLQLNKKVGRSLKNNWLKKFKNERL